MKVKELRPESKVDVIELMIRQKGEARDFSSRSGSTGKVADAKAVDDEGTEVSVSLWNEEIERVQANDRIRITNGRVRERRGNIQVGAGQFGEVEVLRQPRWLGNSHGRRAAGARPHQPQRALARER